MTHDDDTPAENPWTSPTPPPPPPAASGRPAPPQPPAPAVAPELAAVSGPPAPLEPVARPEPAAVPAAEEQPVQPVPAPTTGPTTDPTTDPAAGQVLRPATVFGGAPGLPVGPPGAPVPPPLPGAHPQGQQPPPRRGNRRLVIGLIGGGVAAMLCVVSAVALTIVHLLGSGSSTPSGAAAPAPSATPTEQRALEVGDCVDGSTRQYTLRACPKGASRIIATPESAAECPEETDVAGTDSNDQIVCLVSLLAPHAGAPGGGGGVYRVGDCLPNVRTEGMMEIPCSLPGAFHKIVALVAGAGSCAAPAVRQMTWEEAPAARRVLCLADAQGIASPGECVAWTSDRGPVPIEPTPCTNRPVMKFTGRAGDSDGCGRYGGSSWYYVSPRDALPSVKYNCYRKLG